MEVRVLPFEKLLFESDTLAVGTHRLPATHPEFESYGPTSAFLIVFPRNSTAIEHAGGERFLSSPAVAPLYNRGQEYRRRRISEEGDFCDWVAINPNLLRERFRVSHVAVDPRLYLRQRAVVDALLTGDADPLFVEETMSDVITRVLAGAHPAPRLPTPRSHEELAHAASVILGATFMRNWSLARIAREAGSSPFHLARAFKRVTGMSLHQHRLALRLHASLTMLRDGCDDVGRIALDLGFSDHSHFTAAFRRRFGVTPSRYRARARFS
jgi:AraC family transcriptional regulator